MTVNPDELLIFKMRGVKAKKEEEAEPQPKQAQQAARAEQPSEQRQKKPLFAAKAKPAKPRAEAQRQPEGQLPEWATPAPRSDEDEQRMRQLETLEQKVSLYANPPGGLEAEQLETGGKEKAERNAFSTFAGLLFVINGIVLGYFILPQSSFVIGYILKSGLSSLLLNWSYEYGTSVINLIFTVLSAASGLLMLGGVRKSHMLSGIVGSVMLIAVSFEYLNSSATYLLIATVITFVSVIALTYARMSAVSDSEREAPVPQEINWPRIETF
ncbi:MAG: hypothetical protein M1286_02470 [Candidatus Marsarchaeota archaeon]|nr:hypothetical protein [Candidatus Marsarchaeota archaeon]